jgi:hypothetical protein
MLPPSARDSVDHARRAFSHVAQQMEEARFAWCAATKGVGVGVGVGASLF